MSGELSQPANIKCNNSLIYNIISAYLLSIWKHLIGAQCPFLPIQFHQPKECQLKQYNRFASLNIFLKEYVSQFLWMCIICTI